MMRTVFIVVPAFITAAVPAVFSPVAGLVAFGVVVLAGFSVTRKRPERGDC